MAEHIWYVRREAKDGDAISGRMYNQDGLTFWCIENADKSIPDGTYTCKRDWYHRGNYETFEIIVEGRDRILVHGANYADQLEGCIAPGKSRGRSDTGKPAVWNSKKAHKEYMQSLEGVDEHKIIIDTVIGGDLES
jgi:hypothetical protein